MCQFNYIFIHWVTYHVLELRNGSKTFNAVISRCCCRVFSSCKKLQHKPVAWVVPFWLPRFRSRQKWAQTRPHSRFTWRWFVYFLIIVSILHLRSHFRSIPVLWGHMNEEKMNKCLQFLLSAMVSMEIVVKRVAEFPLPSKRISIL